ncbi:MAG: cobA [Marmoricola sp.]|nr:cobA [Marmoricola sp.]
MPPEESSDPGSEQARAPGSPAGHVQLPVADARVLVLGGDERAAADVARLLGARARVTVHADEACAYIEDLADRRLVTWVRHEPALEDLLAADLTVRPGARPDGTGTVDTPGRGHVTLVGGGPGALGLLTLAGRDAVAGADVVVIDRLAPWEALAWARPDVEVVDVAKIPWGRTTSQDEINRVLVDRALAGRRVVRLKGGDSFVFGRGFEELEACARAGVPTTVVPGVTSSIAVPAAAGIPLTHRGLTQGFTVVSAHVPPGHPDSTVDYAALARCGTTLVFLMGVRTLEAITSALRAAGMPGSTPAAVVADGTRPQQRVVTATLDAIAAAAVEHGIVAPAVVVVGEVVSLRPVTQPNHQPNHQPSPQPVHRPASPPVS